MLTLDRLKYFKEVAQLEHVGKAARNMAISPSVISSAISSLEEEFNCSLFDKDKKRLKINQNGRLLLERTDELLKNIQKIYIDIGSDDFKFKGHFKIGASPILMREFLIDSFLDIQKQYTEITAEFISYDTGVAISNVISGLIDFALVFRSIQHQELEEYNLYDGKFCFVVRKNHPVLKLPKVKRIQFLNNSPAITFRTSIGPNFCENHPIFKKIGISPKHTYFYDNNDTSLRILKATDGWAFVPDIILKKFPKEIVNVDFGLEYSAPMSISLVKNKNKLSSPLFDLLKTNIKEKLNK